MGWRVRSGSTGGTADVPACDRIAARLAPRGPDGCGMLGAGPGRARPPPAVDHRPERGRLPADGRLPARPDRGVQRLHLQLPGPARRAGGPRATRFFSTSDTEVIGKAYAAVGHRLRRPLLRHVRLRHRRARHRPAGPGPGPAGHQAALPGPDRRPAAVRLDPARSAGRRRHRHLDRPDRAGLLHDLPQRGAGAADHPQRRPQAAAGHRPGGRAGRHGTPTTSTGSPEFSRDPDRADWTEQDWEEALLDRLRVAVDRRMVADVPGRGAAVRRHRLLAWWSPCWPRPGRPGCRPSASASTRPAGSRATSSSTARWSPSGSAPTTTRSGSTAAGCCPGIDAAIAAMSEPMVSHDCVAFYLLSEDVSAQRQGGAVRAGRGRGARRLRLVPAAGRGARGTRPSRRTRGCSSTGAGRR